MIMAKDMDFYQLYKSVEKLDAAFEDIRNIICHNKES